MNYSYFQKQKTVSTFKKFTQLSNLLLLSVFVNFSANAKSTQKQVRISSGLATPVLAANKTQNAYIRVALTGFEIEPQKYRTPLNVAIVLDQSSSMSGQKIQQAKQAARIAIEQLDENDIISIITYDSTVNVLVPATKASNKHELFDQLNHIFARGSTALFAGTSKGGYEVRKFLNKERVNRVVLLSDGIANIGPSSPSDLGQLGYAFAKDGISVSTIGLGLGYNEDLMTQLANYSDGNHTFVENAADLARVFEKEFGQAKSIVAQDININIILNENIKPVRIIGRDGDIIGNIITTRMNQIYSQQESYVIVEVQVPANKSGAQQAIAKVNVEYDHMVTNKRFDLNDNITASFSDSEEKVKKSIDKTVYKSAVRQVANERRNEAVILRDQGQNKAAEAKLTVSSNFLQRAAEVISSDELHQESQGLKEEATDVSSSSPSDWRKKRKELKERSYRIEKQQR